jgi:O-antigen ligase
VTIAKLNWTALMLSLMILVVPAVGVPTEELLQDTLKSIVVAAFALAAAFAFFWHKHHANTVVHLHSLLYLPLGLTIYALGSMLWSHAYLGGVEAVRWFLFSLILFLGLNTLTRQWVTMLTWCIHLGAVLACLWAALQFWFDWPFFAQGPNPASTFVNRNFFAEFVVCTLPFSVLLLTRAQDKISVFLLTFSLAFNVVALMMTGTRSALVGLLILALLLPAIALRYRRQWSSGGWRIAHGVGLATLFAVTIFSLGSLPTHNPKLVKELGASNALDRAFTRTLSIAQRDEYKSGSFSIRARMWQATTRVIAAHPVAGVGAGAWEVQIPRFQGADTQLETDYYAHNELLQLLAEYGLTGWLFLLLLVAYLCWAAFKTWTDRSPRGLREAPMRAMTLASLLVFLLVSNAGFPWRLAATGALFALSLAVLGASDVRLGYGSAFLTRWGHCKPHWAIGALCATAIAAGLALYVGQQAVACESKIVRAVKIALTISRSAAPNDPRWDQPKFEMLNLVNEGIVINPHYRKLIPIVADSLASWGDWKNATWIWEAVLESRPNVVAILANVARGHLQAGDFAKVQDDLNRIQSIQPTAPALPALEVLLLSKTGQYQQAIEQATALLQSGFIDRDLVQTAYVLGLRHQNPALAIHALELGIKTWPSQAVDGWLKLGNLYDSELSKDEQKAQHAYQRALDTSQPAYKNSVWAMIPSRYQAKMLSN